MDTTISGLDPYLFMVFVYLSACVCYAIDYLLLCLLQYLFAKNNTALTVDLSPKQQFSRISGEHNDGYCYLNFPCESGPDFIGLQMPAYGTKQIRIRKFIPDYSFLIQH